MKKIAGLILISAIGVFAIVVLFQAHRRAEQRHLISAARLELTDVLSRWDQAGRPQDQALSEFMRTGPHETVVSNLSITFDGKDYYTQFATTRLGFPGILLITTNRELILIKDSSFPELVTDR
jgi:hypothetical protein